MCFYRLNVFWAHRMLEIEADREYADVMERVLYNGLMSGISLDGTKYFYVNPLEVWPSTANHRDDMRRVKVTRVRMCVLSAEYQQIDGISGTLYLFSKPAL
jgi:DUF1680 family protein